MTATHSFKLENGLLSVNGVTPSGVPYEIEITKPAYALRWAEVLAYAKYKRLTMGPERLAAALEHLLR